MKEITLPKVRSDVRHSWYLYPILVNREFLKIGRSEFIEALRAKNIGTSVHFIPVHLQPYYRDKFNYKKGDFENTEYVYDRVISLPIHSAMSLTDAQDVVAAVKKIAQH